MCTIFHDGLFYLPEDKTQAADHCHSAVCNPHLSHDVDQHDYG